MHHPPLSPSRRGQPIAGTAQLNANNQTQPASGGPTGFHNRVWKLERQQTQDGGEAVVCTYTSRDGEEVRVGVMG